MPTLQIADKTTLDSVNTKVDTINTNAARLTSARATKIDNIGATGDTGGSATAGTVMAKLNALFSSSGGSSNIGATGDTGGSTTAGTVMAKLNALLARPSVTITPSSTNIVTLGSNLTLTHTEPYGDTKQTSTYTKYVQAPGIYRFYCTCSFAVAQGTYSASYYGAASATMYINVFKLGTSSTSSLSKALYSTQGAAVASTTYTLDVPLEIGDRVQIYVKATSAGYTDACGSTIGTLGTATISNLSIRGTQNIIDAPFV